MGNKNNWDAEAMKGTLISDMEREVREGICKAGEQPATIAAVPEASALGKAAVPEASASGKDEPTKGVQTYIPMSQYRRLNDIKLTRRENIAALVSQAIDLWLDVQEGKAKVNKVI